MTIAVDFTSSKVQTGTGTGTTLAHTCSGADRILYVSVAFDTFGGSSPTVTDISYNGVSATLIADVGAGGAGRRNFLFRLVAPNTGNNNIVATWTSTAVQAWICAISLTGVDQTTPETGSPVLGEATGANISLGSIASTATDLLLGFVYLNNLTIGDVIEGSGQTLQESESGGGVLWISSKAGSSPTGTLSWVNPSQSYGAIGISVAESAASASISQADTTPEDGVQQTVTCTGMTGPITAATLGGYDILSLLSGTDPASPITYTLDISSLAEGTNASLPRLGVSLDLVFTTATDGAVTQSGIVIQPKTGWALVELEDTINKDANGLGATIEADTGITITSADAVYHETANNASITVNLVYTSDLTTAGQSTKIILQDGGTSPATSYSDGFYPYGEAGGSGSKVVQSINISNLRIGL